MVPKPMQEVQPIHEEQLIYNLQVEDMEDMELVETANANADIIFKSPGVLKSILYSVFDSSQP